MVIDIFDVEVRFCAGVGRAHILLSQELAAGCGGLDIETVVAYKSENLTATIDAVITEHLAGFYDAGARTLVGYVLYKIGIAGHRLD